MKFEEKTETSKLVDMDEILKIKIADRWERSAEQYEKGNYINTFRNYRFIFSTIKPYDFPNKHTIVNLIITIQEYISSLGGKPLDVKAQIEFNERKIMLKDLLDRLMDLLPEAFKDLGLWFRNIKIHNDIDRELSVQNYGDEKTLIKKKIKKLEKLSVKQILEYMSANSKHDVYAKALNNNVI